jgi:anti-sigma factor RsiW
MNDLFHPTSDRLEAFVEGTLQDADRAVIDSHLLGCHRCQTEVEEWRNLFAALSGLPQFEPSANFMDRVMAGVRVHAPVTVWQQLTSGAAWQRYAARASEKISQLGPRARMGLSLAAAFTTVPLMIAAGVAIWLLQQSSLTTRGAVGYVTTWLVEGMQGMGSTALTAVVRTDVAVWVTARFTEIMQSGGLTGVGTTLAVGGVTTVLSAWVLYRNLFRSPTRESNNVMFSF